MRCPRGQRSASSGLGVRAAGGWRNGSGSPSARHTPVSKHGLTVPHAIFELRVCSSHYPPPTPHPQLLLLPTWLKPEAGWPSRLPAFPRHLCSTVSTPTVNFHPTLLVPGAAIRAVPSAWNPSHRCSPSAFSGKPL